MSVKPARPPRGLRTAGAALWRSLALQVADDGRVLDAREARWLADAAREADQLADVEAALADTADLVVLGSQRQPVAHPLLGEARRSRQVIAALLARLDLDEPDEVAAPARTGSGSRTTSESARKAALARWHGHPGGAS